MLSTILTIYKTKKSLLWIPVIAFLLVSVLAFNAKVFSTMDAKMSITFEGDTWQTDQGSFSRQWLTNKGEAVLTVDLSRNHNEEYEDRPFAITGSENVTYRDIRDGEGNLQGKYEVTIPLTEEQTYHLQAEFIPENDWGLDGGPKSFQIEKDTTAPELSFSGVEDGALYKQEVRLRMEVEEQHFSPGQTEVAVTRNGESYPADASWDGKRGNITFHQDGEYEVTLRSTDLAGNSSEQSISFFINRKGAELTVQNEKGEALNQDGVYHLSGIKIIASSGITLDSAVMTVKKKNADGKEEEISVETTINKREAVGTLSDLTDGTYSVHVTVKEKHAKGQEYDLPAFTFKVDRTAPELSITGVENNGEYDEEKEVVFLAKDENINLVESFISITKDGQKWGEAKKLLHDAEGGKYTFEFFEEGRYEVTFTAKDMAGNSASHDTVKFTVDTSEPNISYKGINENQKYYNRPVDATFIVTDFMIDLEKTKLEVTKEGETTTVPFSSTNFFFRAEADYSFTEDGQYAIKVTSADGFNRESEMNKTIVLDQVKPKLSMTGVENKKYKEAQTVDFKVSDTNLSLETTTLTVTKDGEEYKLPKRLTNTSPTEASLMGVEFKEDGVYVLQFESTDKAGNTAKLAPIEFTVDQNAPVITIDGVKHNEHYATEKPVVIKINDLTLDLDNTEITVEKNDEPYLDDPEKIHSSRNEVIYQHFFKEEGTYKINVRTEDELKNKKEKSLTFTIDATAPKINLNGIENNAFVQQGKTLTIKVEETNFKDNNVTIESTRTKPDGTTESYDLGTWKNEDITSRLAHTFTKDGIYSIKVTSVDKAGNKAEVKQLRFTVDNVKPVISISGVEDKVYYAARRNVTLRVEELNFSSNDVKLNVTKDGKPYNMGTWENKDIRSSLSHEFKEDGAYQITMTAADAAGNAAERLVTSFTIDKTVPVLSVTGVEDGEDYKTDKAVEFRLADTNLDLNTTTLTVTKNGKPYRVGSFTVNGSRAALRHTFKEEGRYTINFAAVDKAKNRTVHEEISFIIDKTNPAVKIEGAENNSYNPGSKTITVSVDELNYSTNNVELVVTKDNRPYNMGTWRNSAKLSMLSHNFTQDGDYTISVTARDKAGNGPVTQKLTFTIDKVDPSITITGADNDAHYNVNKQISVEINDLNLDVNKITVTRNGGAYSVGGFNVSGNIASLAHTFSQEGTYKIVVNATDKAGNSMSKELLFTIDKTAPVITPKVKGSGTSLKNGEFINTVFTPEFALDVAEDQLVSVTLNGQPIPADRIPMASRDMQYTYNVVAKDKAGNETKLTLKFTLDTTRPVVEISGIIDGFFNDNVVPVIKYSDKHLDDMRTIILLNDQPFTSGTALTQEGDYVLKVVVEDLAKNKTTRTIHFTIDKTEPKISFAEPISNKYFNDQVIPEFLIDSLSPYDIIALTLNGNPYEMGDPINEEGKHVLYFEVKDKAGNIKQLSVEFIIDKTPPRVLYDGVKEEGVYYDPITVNLQLEDPSDKILTVLINGELYEGEVLDVDGSQVIRSTFSDIGTYEITVHAIDEAGNETHFVLPFEIADKSILIKAYENKPLFFGIIVAGLLGAAGATTLAVKRRKRNLDESASIEE